jgi:hypothetical protein
MDGYYKTLRGGIFPLEKQDDVHVSCKNIIELVLP